MCQLIIIIVIICPCLVVLGQLLSYQGELILLIALCPGTPQESSAVEDVIPPAGDAVGEQHSENGVKEVFEHETDQDLLAANPAQRLQQEFDIARHTPLPNDDADLFIDPTSATQSLQNQPPSPPGSPSTQTVAIASQIPFRVIRRARRPVPRAATTPVITATLTSGGSASTDDSEAVGLITAMGFSAKVARGALARYSDAERALNYMLDNPASRYTEATPEGSITEQTELRVTLETNSSSLFGPLDMRYTVHDAFIDGLTVPELRKVLWRRTENPFGAQKVLQDRLKRLMDANELTQEGITTILSTKTESKRATPAQPLARKKLRFDDNKAIRAREVGDDRECTNKMKAEGVYCCHLPMRAGRKIDGATPPPVNKTSTIKIKAQGVPLDYDYYEVRNVVGSAKDPKPPSGGSWKQWFENRGGGETYRCRVCCKTADEFKNGLCGGHVLVKGYTKTDFYFILPICPTCNNSKKLDVKYHRTKRCRPVPVRWSPAVKESLNPHLK